MSTNTLGEHIEVRVKLNEVDVDGTIVEKFTGGNAFDKLEIWTLEKQVDGNYKIIREDGTEIIFNDLPSFWN